MPSTFDPLLRLELQAVGENPTTWGVKTNTNLSLLGDAVAGYLSINIAGSGTYTLTTANAAPDESRRAFLAFTGTLTGNRTIIIPPVSKIYAIRNNTAGAFTLTIKTATGNSLTVARGETITVACDGLDVFSTSPSIPAGVIVMWSGSIASIPSGWALCNGTSGTPDLRDRFVVGAGATYGVGATGGAAAATTSSSGAHAHSGVTAGHNLSIAEMPVHVHSGSTDVAGAHVHGYTAGTASTAAAGGNVFDNLASVGAVTIASGDHSHTFTTGTTGGGLAHVHGIVSDGAHTHAVATLPPYYALAYIMKL